MPKSTTIRCPECDHFMKDISGIGEKKPVIICESPTCPARYKHITCDKCGSNDKKILHLGIANQQFTCNRCGNIWKKLGPTLSRRSQPKQG